LLFCWLAFRALTKEGKTMTTKPTEEQLKPGDKIAVSRKQMVDELVGMMGAQSTLILWDLLLNLRQEDNHDAQVFRRMKEEYLNGDENTCVGLIIGVLKEWESGVPNEPQMGKFFKGMRELATFRFAEKCAEMLQGYNEHEPARAQILDAVKVLRELFAGTLVKVNLKDMPIN
jgi:hypothetical protein